MIREKFTYVLPCYMELGKKKISLTLNWYRNAHFQVLNKTKSLWSPTLGLQMFNAKKIHVSYTLYWNSNRRTDFMNWIVIADKYFLDWLVTMGCIPDDCIKNYHSMDASMDYNKMLLDSEIHSEVTILE